MVILVEAAPGWSTIRLVEQTKVRNDNKEKQNKIAMIIILLKV